MTKFLSGVGLVVGMLVMGIPLIFLKTHIIMDLGLLWDINQITEFGYDKVLGVMLIVNFMTAKKPKSNTEDKDKSHGVILLESFGSSIGTGVLFMIGWGLSYLIHMFI